MPDAPATEEPAEAEAPAEPPAAPRIRPSGRRVLVAAAAAAIVALVAVALAARLDEPVGAGAVDEAQPIVAGPVVGPGEELTGRSAPQGDLPPLALVLDRAPPEGIGDLPAEDQIPRLRALAATRAEPRRLVELGAAYQAAGRNEEAREAFVNALRLDSDDVAAEVGLVLNAAAEGGSEDERAAGALADLAAQNPDNQIVSFNRGWLAAYRRDAQTAESAWRRTIAIDADSRLGRTATQLLGLLETDTGSAGGTGASTP
jgi:tetratricopeptide (TPR) repeat protein